MNTDLKRSWAAQVEDALDQQSVNNMDDDGSRDNSNSSKRAKPNSEQRTRSRANSGKPQELETDPTILQRRQKQIDYGKNTVGYHNYTQQVPIDQRKKQHPKTPDKYTKYSRRSWDMMIKMWRKELHEFDTGSTESENNKEMDEYSIANDDMGDINESHQCIDEGVRDYVNINDGINEDLQDTEGSALNNENKIQVIVYDE